MAGSKKWFLYENDDGIQYAVNIDESNGEVAEFEDISLATDLVFSGGYSQLPKGYEMRYANTRASDGSTRKIWVGKPPSNALGEIFAGITKSILLPSFQSGANIGVAIAYAIVSLVGEKRGATPISGDTGLIDGDAT